jgi:hypothetical protein
MSILCVSLIGLTTELIIKFMTNNFNLKGQMHMNNWFVRLDLNKNFYINFSFSTCHLLDHGMFLVDNFTLLVIFFIIKNKIPSETR